MDGDNFAGGLAGGEPKIVSLHHIQASDLVSCIAMKATASKSAEPLQSSQATDKLRGDSEKEQFEDCLACRLTGTRHVDQDEDAADTRRCCRFLRPGRIYDVLGSSAIESTASNDYERRCRMGHEMAKGWHFKSGAHARRSWLLATHQLTLQFKPGSLAPVIESIMHDCL